jgi:hypothetical protein
MDELLKLGFLALFTGSGAFLGSYLKKKGENLATHEDINHLVEQGTVSLDGTRIKALMSS